MIDFSERQRDRETERQRDRETERQRDRETERQRDREQNYFVFMFDFPECEKHVKDLIIKPTIKVHRL